MAAAAIFSLNSAYIYTYKYLMLYDTNSILASLTVLSSSSHCRTERKMKIWFIWNYYSDHAQGSILAALGLVNK